MDAVALTVPENLVGTLDKYPVVARIHKDKTTTVVISVEGRIGIGIARFNPIDHYNKEIGIHIALARAIKSIVVEYEEMWVSRARTTEEVLAARAAKRRRQIQE